MRMKKRMKSLISKLRNPYIHACLAGVFVVLMYIALLYIDKIVPFGNNTWIMYDLKRQYVDFYSYYKTIISGENNIFYSFSTALGSGLIGFFVYYLSNPLFLIFGIFTPDRFPLAISIIIGITLMLGAIIMDRFLSWYISAEEVPLCIWIFSIAWSFSGFLIAQSMNMMWTDVVILVPLLIFLLERMCDFNAEIPYISYLDRKSIGYIFLLSLMLLFNYYITYQVLIFVGLWTLMRLYITRNKIPFKMVGKVALSTIIPVGIDMWVLLPTLFELANSPKDITKLGLEATGRNLNPLDVFSKQFVFAYDVIQPRFGLPQLYAGVAIILLVFLFFIGTKVSKREKIALGVFILFFVVSFCVDLINLFWHAGMEPSGHPYRQAPLCVFLLIICALRAYLDVCESDDLIGKKIIYIVISAGIVCLVLGLVAVHGYEYVNRRMILINLGLITLYTIFISILVYLKNKHECISILVSTVLSFFFLAELVSNASFTYPFIAMNGEMANTYSLKVNVTKEVVARIKSEDSTFYRMENLTPRQQNDSMMYDYNGITHYSSAGMTYVRYFLQKCGYNDDSLYTHYGHDNTATMDSILGVKYLITEDSSLMHPSYIEKDNYFENPYTLPVAIAVNGYSLEGIDGIDNPKDIEGNPFALQEDLIRRVANNNDLEKVFVPASTITSKNGTSITCDIETTIDGELYMYVDGLIDKYQNMLISIDDGDPISYANASCYKILNLGFMKKGENHRITIIGDEDTDFGEPIFVTEDIHVLGNICDSIKGNSQPDISKVSSSHLKVDVPLAEGLFTTIPYEEGWHISLNGVKITPVCVYGALMYIPTGEQGILDMYFIPKGFTEGVLVSVVTLLSIFYICIRKRQKSELN